MTDDEEEEPTPLSAALFARDFETAAALLAAGAALDDILEDDGASFLHEAARDGDAGMVEFFLLQGCPRTLASFDYIAQTPLIAAAENGNLDAVRRLLGAGVEVNANEQAQIGNTAIREAARGGHVEMARLLLAAGADPTIRGWMGISAVDQAHVAINGGIGTPASVEIQQLFAAYPSAIRDRSADR